MRKVESSFFQRVLNTVLCAVGAMENSREHADALRRQSMQAQTAAWEAYRRRLAQEEIENNG